jgi:hypothetical protein
LRSLLKRSSTFVVFLVLVLGLTLTGKAQARPAVCGKLERQLASAGSSSGGSQKFAKAARAQAQQLQIARGQARNAGCGGSLFFGSDNGQACKRINSTIRRMESNLANLQSKAGGGGRVNRSRILAALEANDCNNAAIEDTIAVRKERTESKRKERGILSILFSGSKEPKRIETAYDVPSSSAAKGNKQVTVINGGKKTENTFDFPGGTFRTICVRTCDGYYFPVSFSTSSSRFATDEKACSTMCPGTETKLYYHSVPDQEPEDMISLKRERYSALPTAFKYRREGIGADPACSCQAAPKETLDTASAGGAAVKSKWIPYPPTKPILLDDEETRVNRAGGLDAASIQQLLEVKLNTQTLASQQNVRVVGPVFLPSQSKATN